MKKFLLSLFILLSSASMSHAQSSDYPTERDEGIGVLSEQSRPEGDGGTSGLDLEPLSADKLVHSKIVHLFPKGESESSIRRYMIDSIHHAPRTLKTLVVGVPHELTMGEKLTLIACSENFAMLEYERTSFFIARKKSITMERDKLEVLSAKSAFSQIGTNLIEMKLIVTAREGMIFPETGKFSDQNRCHATFIVGSEW